MFQIMTQESIEPVAMRGAGTGESSWCFVADHRNIHQRKLNKKIGNSYQSVSCCSWCPHLSHCPCGPWNAFLKLDQAGEQEKDRHIKTVGTSLFIYRMHYIFFIIILKNYNFSVDIFAITLVFPVKCSSIGLNPKDGVSLVYKELYTSHWEETNLWWVLEVYALERIHDFVSVEPTVWS